MDAQKAVEEILEAAKPVTVTVDSRAALVEDCNKSGIMVDADLNISSKVKEEHLDNLANNLRSPILKMVVRKALRKYS
ncbi:MAG: hypothetical protein GY816_14315 [Cytophagales bacterium]|nr:hypothetical protein [Cytophagales bacterium]